MRLNNKNHSMENSKKRWGYREQKNKRPENDQKWAKCAVKRENIKRFWFNKEDQKEKRKIKGWKWQHRKSREWEDDEKR